MTRYLRVPLSILCLLAAIGVACAFQIAPAPLNPADRFPSLSGQTLSGKNLELPSAAAGAPALCVFAFTHAAGKDSKLWTERLKRDSPSLAVFTVIVLESVPKLFRGAALAGIKSGIPAPMHDRTLVLYTDEALWKQRMAVTDDSRAYLALLWPDGRILWINHAAFNEAEYGALRGEVQKVAGQR